MNKISILNINDTDNQSVTYHTSAVENSVSYVKVNSLEDFYKIDDDIEHLDTTKCLTLITTDDKELSLHQYTNQVIKFIKIYMFKKDGGDLLIATDNNHYISDNLKQWQTKDIQLWPGLPDYDAMPAGGADLSILKKMDGYDNSKGLLSAINELKTYGKTIKIPAVFYCNRQVVRLGKSVYQGYLPSIGQLVFLLQYIKLINLILSYTGNSPITILGTENIWSSSEYSNDRAWYMSKYSGSIAAFTKGGGLNVLPLFKKVK